MNTVRHPVRCCLQFGLLLTLACLPACDVAAEAAVVSEDARAGQVTTLRWVDDLQSCFGFARADYSLAINGDRFSNRGSDISYHRWVKDALVVGIEGQSKGVIKDIGDPRTKKTQHSILPFLERRGSAVVDTSAEGSSLPAEGLPLTDAAQKQASAPVVLGHTYLVRLDDSRDSRFVALRVLEYCPGQSVTFRWRQL